VLSLATFRRSHLDETVAARGGFRIRIIERPGLWMPADRLAHVVGDLQTIVGRCIPEGELDYGAASGDPDRLSRSILTIVYDSEARPIGFNALSILECELRGRPLEVLHLGLVMVDPDVRAAGLSGLLYGLTCFLVFARQQLRPLWISNVTQVPAVFGMVADNFANVYPTSNPADRQTFDHLHLARQIMAHHRQAFGVGPEAEFDETRSVIKDAYTGGSDNLKKYFDDAPKHRDPAHNETCRRELDYTRGDDFLQLGQFTLQIASRYFTRSARVISPGALAMQFGARALQSMVAPALQWFSPDVSWDELRPALPLFARGTASRTVPPAPRTAAR
jgi:hypothetical protein